MASDNSGYATADPGRCLHPTQMNLAVSPGQLPLAGDVGGLGLLGTKQPISDSGVEASSDRILANSAVVITEEGPDFDKGIFRIR